AGLVVERRVVHQLPERTLAAIELGRHLREVGHGMIEVAEQTSRICLVLDQVRERSLAPVEARAELVDRACGASDVRGELLRLGRVPRELSEDTLPTVHVIEDL